MRFLLLYGLAVVAATGVIFGSNPIVDDPLQPEPVALEVSCGACFLLVGDSLEAEVSVRYSDGSIGEPRFGLAIRESARGIVEWDGLLITAVGPGDVGLTFGVWSASSHLVMLEASLTIGVRETGDMDNDLLPDDWEIAHGLDPTRPGRGDDPDRDGLSNWQELQRGTHPMLRDTDGDGRSDGEEVHWDNTDPLVPDPDPNAPPAPITSSCTVSALNRSAPVDAEGVWVVPNVPSTMGRVRVRATCVDPDGTVRHGQSDFVEVPPRGVVAVPEINFETPAVSPATLALVAPATQLEEVGQSAQLTATITFPDSSSAEVADHEGTSWTTSNAGIVSISPAGLATAVSSGRAIVSASHDGATGFVALTVLLGGDSDGDGLPDDWELANGLDPSDPLDALLDPDRDGLSTLQEFQLGTDPFNPDTDGDWLNDGAEIAAGTNPLLRDTDGDLVSDGLEVIAGSDPLDPQSVNLGPILEQLVVTPLSFPLIVNTVSGEASRQLEVEATLIDGSVLDATRPPYGTIYTSDDLAIASFGSDPGRVFGGLDGATTVRVTNGPVEVEVEVLVEVFAPVALGRVLLPGNPNAVQLYGSYALVAASRPQLAVVDVSNPSAPTLVATATWPRGRSVDIAIDPSAPRAYLALAGGGIGVVDIADPLNPTWLGGVATRGPAWGVLVDPPWLYVADVVGVSVVDISNPAVPSVVATVKTPGSAWRLAFAPQRQRLVVADGSVGVTVVDVSDPLLPVLVSSTSAGSPRHVADVATTGERAYSVSGDYNLGGVVAYGWAGEAAPVRLGATPSSGFALTAIDLDGSLALTSDYFYTNAVPIFDVSTSSPSLRAVLDFSQFGDPEGHDLAIRGGYVYLVAGRESFGRGPTLGWMGGQLQIGRYAKDGGLTAPEVRIVAPQNGTEHPTRLPIVVEVEAFDDVSVERVELWVGEVLETTLMGPPYVGRIVAPSVAGSLGVEAIAFDRDGNQTSTSIEFEILPDDQPVAQILFPLPDATVIEDSGFDVLVSGSDDFELVGLELFVDGVSYGVNDWSPTLFEAGVGPGATSVTLEALATDDIGQTSSSGELVLVVEPDPPPAVVILTPTPGAEVAAGSLVQVVVAAADNRQVEQVEILVDGVSHQLFTSEPYQLLVTVPLAGAEIEVEAIATDDFGNTASATVAFEIVFAGPTTVEGRVVDDLGGVRAGAAVRCGVASTASAADGTFSIAAVPTAGAGFACSASVVDGATGVELVGATPFAPGVPGGVTDVGDVLVGGRLLVSGGQGGAPAWVSEAGPSLLPAAEANWDTYATAAVFDGDGRYWVSMHYDPPVLHGGEPKSSLGEGGGGGGDDGEGPVWIEEGLQEVDLASGQPLTEPQVPSQRLIDLAADPATGRILALGYDSAWDDGLLLQLEPESGAEEVLATLAPYWSAGLAFDSDARRLWLMRESGAGWSLQLLDPDTGAVLGTTAIARSGEISGLTWRPGHGTLLVASESQIYEVQPETGASSVMMDFGSASPSTLALRSSGGRAEAIEVTGRVVDENGEPQPGVEVAVVGVTSVSGADGTFSLTAVVPRTARLRVFAQNCCSRAFSQLVLAEDGVDVGDIEVVMNLGLGP